ncbi:flagellar brake protein [Lutispora saccharofermentans]|uniref:PilZ domain-containing protein n=1 Tax=Lutispora saccharofermentans TaxID=3024236 RepID=A0ABT1NA84_9FIRM|nr:PilZ domain-containing protein [Lutispora saccharofermentans]
MVLTVSLNKFFSIGDKVQVKTIGKENSYSYASQVANIENDDIIEILFPMYKRNTIYILNGERIELIINKQDAVLEFSAVVIDKNYESIPVLKLKITSEPKRVQRRNFYRLKIVKPIKYRVVSQIDSDEEIPEYDEGILTDISEGGIMFYARKEMDINNLLELEMDFESDTTMKLRAVIVRKQYNIEKSHLYEYGARFKDLGKADSKVLTKFIFQEQRKLLKKGLI